MNSLNSSQKAKVQQLMGICGSHIPERALADHLKNCKWDVNRAMDDWYNRNMDSKYPLPKSKTNEKNIQAFFNQFKEDNVPIIEDKIGDFFEAIGVSDLEDPITLLISYRMGAKSQGKFTYQEFKKGCEALALDNQAAWYKAIPDLQKNWQKDQALFEEVYNFTFIYSQEEGYKNITKEIAVALWPILLKGKCGFLEDWIKFIEEKHTKDVITKDQWEGFYTLIKQTGGNFNNFEDDGCWTSQIDSFVEYMESK